MSEWTELPITDGTSQNARFPAALQEGYINVDEMSFEELLTMSTEFAAALRFYNLNNKPDGSWADLFATNDAVVMAKILSLDLRGLESKFLLHFRLNQENLPEDIYQLAKEVDAWFKRLNAAVPESASALSWKILEVIEQRLVVDLHSLGEFLHQQGRAGQEGIAFDFSSFDPIWGIKTERGQSQFPKSRLPELTNTTQEKGFLRSAFYSFTHAISYLQTITPAYLQNNLRSQSHNPAVGLFMAFLKLFRKAQEKLNAFPQRHLNFYYDDCLKVTPQRSVPDSAYLVFEPGAGAQDVFVHKGTEFSAGKDSDGKELVYVADNDLVVTDAKVQSLWTLYFERDKLISPERELRGVTRAQITVLPTTAQALGDKELQGWPLFGAGKNDPGQGIAEDADIGVAVASPVLLLREGLRTIDVVVYFVDSGDEDEVVTRVLKSFWDTPTSVKSDMPDKVFTQIFQRYVLTHQEWFPEKDTLDVVGTAKSMVAQSTSDFKRNLLEEGRQDLCYNAFLIALLHQAESEEAFFGPFGKLMSRYLLTEGDWLTQTDRDSILEKAQNTVSDATSLEMICNLLKQDREALFYTLLRRVFTIDLTAESGWHEVRDYRIGPALEGNGVHQQGLRFGLTLEPDIEPIVPYATETHGGTWEAGQPLIRFLINSQANFFSYSLFRHLNLRDIVLATEVHGIKTLLAYNNHGQLDPSKPFNPFGPLPTRNSYFVVGNYEMAKKNITALTLNAEWGELPSENGGFEEYYRAYETTFLNESFEADVSVFQDGQWQPEQKEKRKKLALFDTEKTGARVSEKKMLKVDTLNHFKPINQMITEDEFGFDLRARNGFFKFTLTGPDTAFGHKDYPVLLTKVLSENAKRKKPKPIPNPPYTPLFNQMTLDYKAKHIIQIGPKTSFDHDQFSEKVFHVHPFGVELVFPNSKVMMPTLVPQYQHDGNLFIGISAQQLRGILTLFFHMQEDSTQEILFERPEIAWFYLTSNSWRQLDASRVISNTTDGFLSSGIVTLNIPDDINQMNTILPKNVFWLRVSAPRNLKSFCSVYSVQTQALKVTWDNRNNAPSHLRKNIPAGTIRQPVASIPGVGKVTQLAESFGGKLEESSVRLKTRISGRLRHKHRASMAWDYEQLILERFPEVFKVKCFSNMTSAESGIHPGHVLIVVVPFYSEREHGKQFSPMLDAENLSQIRDFVQELTSPFVTIEVRNPIYEQIQVKCAVKFLEDMNSGLSINKLNEAIVNFISPWQEGGYQARFGWRMKQEDIESVIREQNYVEYVTKFSMLHITEDDNGDFSLGDTARLEENHEGDESPQQPSLSAEDISPREIRPTYPWSLAIPMREHCIETIKTIEALKAEPTGIDDLEVGATFII